MGSLTRYHNVNVAIVDVEELQRAVMDALVIEPVGVIRGKRSREGITHNDVPEGYLNQGTVDFAGSRLAVLVHDMHDLLFR